MRVASAEIGIESLCSEIAICHAGRPWRVASPQNVRNTTPAKEVRKLRNTFAAFKFQRPLTPTLSHRARERLQPASAGFPR